MIKFEFLINAVATPPSILAPLLLIKHGILLLFRPCSIIAQVVVAEFDNPEGLEKVGDSLYKVTANSGDFDGIGQAGSFYTGVLEMSNVDMASELTDMIVTQRGYQSNSKIITVSDELLETLINMKR